MNMKTDKFIRQKFGHVKVNRLIDIVMRHAAFFPKQEMHYVYR